MQSGELSYRFRVAGWNRIRALDPSAEITSGPSQTRIVVSTSVVPAIELEEYLKDMGWKWILQTQEWHWNCPERARVEKEVIRHAYTNSDCGWGTTLLDVPGSESGNVNRSSRKAHTVVKHDDADPLPIAELW